MKRLLRNAGIAVGIALAALIAIVTIRAATLASKQITAAPAPPLAIDRDAALARLSRAVQFRTTPGDDAAPFIAWLTATYPRVHASLPREQVGNALLYTWRGTDPSLAPVLLMGHYDTVPVEPASLPRWEQPPFSGAISGGYIWGRGTLDDKSTVLGILEAAELLLAQNHRPRRTVLFAFGGDEETGGKNGAAAVAKLLASRGTKLHAVIDEGGIISAGTIDGTARPVALIGIAEKGSATIELLSRGHGGHSSMPPPRTEVGTIAAAVDRVQSRPFAAGVHGASEAMFRWLAPELTFAPRLLMANLWLFEPLLASRTKRSASFNAILRTTTAPTIIEGGVKDNVIPSEARAVINFRIQPRESVRSVVAHVRDAVASDRVRMRVTDGWEPSPVSDPDAPQFRELQRTVAQTFPDAIVAPFLVVGATDARYFRSLTPNVYRFMPVRIEEPDLARIHGTNERLSAQGYLDAIRFYRTLIVNMTR